MAGTRLKIEKPAPHVALVVFDRPDRLNMLNSELMAEIDHAAASFSADVETRVVIFTGADRDFSAGIELTDHRPASSTLGQLRDLKRGPGLIRKIYEMEQVTIAAINGRALGGGACIAAACDFRIGAKGCRIGFPESRLGMNLSWVSLPLVVHLIGPARAKEMVILGESHDAGTLLEWGFLNATAPDEKLLEAAVDMGRKYAAMPPIPAQMIKKSVNHITSALDQAIMHMDRDQWLLTAGTRDFSEGISAFFQKREGAFKGD